MQKPKLFSKEEEEKSWNPSERANFCVFQVIDSFLMPKCKGIGEGFKLIDFIQHRIKNVYKVELQLAIKLKM